MTTINKPLMDAVLADVALLLEGDKPASIKAALWYAAVSANNSLDQNCKIARVLRTFVASEALPEKHSELFDRVEREAGTRKLTSVTRESIYITAEKDAIGALDDIADLPVGYAAQVAWRDTVAKMFGLGYKTASFAALLLRPDICELVPVDRHVLARLGYVERDSPSARKKYLEVEHKVIAEQAEAGIDLPHGQWHWYKWEEYRQLKGVSKHHTLELHDDLNVRKY